MQRQGKTQGAEYHSGCKLPAPRCARPREFLQWISTLPGQCRRHCHNHPDPHPPASHWAPVGSYPCHPAPHPFPTTHSLVRPTRRLYPPTNTNTNTNTSIISSAAFSPQTIEIFRMADVYIPPENFSWLVDGLLAGSGKPSQEEHVNFLLKEGVHTIVTLMEEQIEAKLIEGRKKVKKIIKYKNKSTTTKQTDRLMNKYR